MSARPHYLRGYGNPPTIPMVYADEPTEPRSGRFINLAADMPLGCSTCRDSELHCLTPESCHLPTADQIREAEDVSSLHRLSWPLCMLVIALAALASVLWPMGFAR